MLLIALAFVSVQASLANVPGAAIQYWYLNFSPLILAAYRFGLRGALVGAIVSIVSVVLFYRTALEMTLLNLDALDDTLRAVVSTATSPVELRDIALRAADLRSRDPRAEFLRAATGSVLLIASGLLVGVMADRSRTRDIEYSALERLRRYLSPAVADAIMAGQEHAGLASARKERRWKKAWPRRSGW